MSFRAAVYSLFIVLAGFCVLAAEFFSWRSPDPERYLSYLAVAVACYRLKFSISSQSQGLPVSLLFVLCAFMDFNLAEMLFLGCVATLSQSLGTGQTKPYQVLFHGATMALAIDGAYSTYHSALLEQWHVGTAVALLSAAAVLFAINTFSVASAVALAETKPLLRTWREGHFWAFPYYLSGAALTGLIALVTRVAGWPSALLVVPAAYLGSRFFAALLDLIETGRKRAEEAATLHLRTIEALATAIEARDPGAYGHLRRVQVLAVVVGKELRLSRPELEALRTAALLHNIGKLAVPDHIVSKPGKLTREELEKVKIHPIVGAEILEGVRFPYPVTPTVRSHHERWDGSGYPDGLRGEEIPLGARILAAVDSLDALSSERQYRRAVGFQEALRKVANESGAAFDPAVIAAIERHAGELEKLALAGREDRTARSPKLKVRSELQTQGEFELPANILPAEKNGGFLASIAAATQEVHGLFELARDLGNSLSLNETYTLVAMRVKRLVPYDAFAIWSPKDGYLRAEYATGETFHLLSDLVIPIGEGISGRVAERREHILNGDPALEPGYPGEEQRRDVMRSALSVPLTGMNGLVGVMTLYHGERDAFTPDNARVLLAIASKVGLAIDNALKFQQAESSAATDYMTGLPNARSLFLQLESELARCRRSGAPVVVMVCDMNGFKAINDQFGHLEGNRLLRVTAAKLRENCREYDYVARMGGDEFVFIFGGLTPDQVEHKMRRLNALTREAGREACGVETLSLSIGHSVYPDDGRDPEQLLAEADRRMYLAKQKEKMKIAEPRGFDFDQVAAR